MLSCKSVETLFTMNVGCCCLVDWAVNLMEVSTFPLRQCVCLSGLTVFIQRLWGAECAVRWFRSTGHAVFLLFVLKLEFDSEIKQTHEQSEEDDQLRGTFNLKAYCADVYWCDSELVVAVVDFYFLFLNNPSSVLAHPNWVQISFSFFFAALSNLWNLFLFYDTLEPALGARVHLVSKTALCFQTECGLLTQDAQDRVYTIITQRESHSTSEFMPNGYILHYQIERMMYCNMSMEFFMKRILGKSHVGR